MAIKINTNTVIDDNRGILDVNGQVGSATSVLSSNGTAIVWRNISQLVSSPAQGTQGLQGTLGRQGLQGTNANVQGTQGLQGTLGRQGLQGTNATVQGNQGLQGVQGSTGTPIQGSQGVQGSRGAQGLQGAAGTTYTTTSDVEFNSLGVGVAPSGSTGDIRATANITAYFSDLRLKENINRIENALQKLLSIQGVTYTSNEVAERYGYTDKSEQVGVIAQEIEKVLPQIVTAAPFDIAQNPDGTEYSKSGENYKTVRYEKIAPLLIEAIKEQQEQIDTIKSFQERIEFIFGYTNSIQSADELTIRNRRNFLLMETDWIEFSDLDKDIKSLWKKYRQELRDIPQQEGFPLNVVWPSKPQN